ncbi:hypothetical protein ACP70R_018222 [Stipagrostis hirtigluma subsp. patula]
MEQRGRRRHIPAFGEWNQQCEELPITQYFESAMHGGRCYHAAGEMVLFRSSASPPPHKPAKKVRSTVEKQQAGSRRQFVVADGGPRAARRPRVVRAVDEDLYTVPPDLLRTKPKGRKKVRSLWMGCVGLNCVA